MTTQLVFVKSANLYVLLSDNKILQIQKSTDPHINTQAVRVEEFDTTTALTHVHVADRNVYGDQAKLYLDAADITTFAGWLRGQMPNASTKVFGRAFEGMFPGSMCFKDVLKAAGWAAGVPNMRRPSGEEEYYIARARASDPEGFAQLAAEGW